MDSAIAISPADTEEDLFVFNGSALKAAKSLSSSAAAKTTRRSLRQSLPSSKAAPMATPPRTRAQRATRKETTPPRLTSRQAKKLKQSNATKTSTTAKPATKIKVETARARVRRQIQEHTKPRRDAFLLHHRAKFEPLLPPTNYISKLDSTTRAIVPLKTIGEQPAGVKADLRPHQRACLEFLVNMHHNAMSAVLGDEMGLGKTLQTLSLIQYLEENHPTTSGIARPYLVVCPLSVLETWCDEARKWTPGLRVVRLHGSATERALIKASANPKADTANFDIMVTTYEVFTAEATWFQQTFVWRYCILDEGHKIKNDETLHARALQGLSCEHRLLLTGTPLQNDMRELWSLLHWLYPDVFGKNTSTLFEDSFNLTAGKVNSDFMDSARELLEVIMIRRLKSDPGINLGLPPKTEVLLYLPLTPFQQFWYTRLLTRLPNPMLKDLFGNSKQKEEVVSKAELNDDTQMNSAGEESFAMQSQAMIQQAITSEDPADKDTTAYKKLMNLLMQLRKCCSHPYQVKGAAPEPYLLGDHIMHASSKFIVLGKMIDELVIKQGKKIIIFSGFTQTLDYCEDLFTIKGSNQYDKTFRHVRFDGGTSRARRNLQVRLFNDPTSEYKVMLISTRAGGLGLNLAAACCDVVFLDQDWNPQVDLQAESRAHRIGQTKPVTVYKIATQGTVEEQMMGRIRKKLYLSMKVTEAMQDLHSSSSRKRKRQPEADQDDSGMQEEPQVAMSQLKSLLRRGAATLSGPRIEASTMASWSLDTIIDKCKDKPLDHLVKADTSEGALENTATDMTEEEWLRVEERVETAVFDGVKYEKAAEAAAKVPTELSREDRRVGKETRVLVGSNWISKESVGCAQWEAVATLSGKGDLRLAEPKREKAAPINHQDYCQVCADGGEVSLCSRCPRVYHTDCLPASHKAQASGTRKSFGGTFICPQHSCSDCGRVTSDAGGLIFRCRNCFVGKCGDCLDFDKAVLIGETLPEYEVLGFQTKSNAWYIECEGCVEEKRINPAWANMVAGMALDAEEKYQKMMSEDVDDEALTAVAPAFAPAQAPTTQPAAKPKTKTERKPKPPKPAKSPASTTPAAPKPSKVPKALPTSAPPRPSVNYAYPYPDPFAPLPMFRQPTASASTSNPTNIDTLDFTATYNIEPASARSVYTERPAEPLALWAAPAPVARSGSTLGRGASAADAIELD